MLDAQSSAGVPFDSFETKKYIFFCFFFKKRVFLAKNAKKVEKFFIKIFFLI
jgi:hypothetical protein